MFGASGHFLRGCAGLADGSRPGEQVGNEADQRRAEHALRFAEGRGEVEAVDGSFDQRRKAKREKAKGKGEAAAGDL